MKLKHRNAIFDLFFFFNVFVALHKACLHMTAFLLTVSFLSYLPVGRQRSHPVYMH